MADIATFNGVTKRIVISSGITSVDVQDLYSRWKGWAQESDNLKYFQAMRTFGGDSTIPGQFAPRYFFLTNDWRIEVNFGEVDFGVNLYTDELDSPVIVSSGSSASIRNSDAVNVETDILKALDYDGKVIINSSIGVSGTTYPTGTFFQPVNNIADAKIIASFYGFNEYHIFGTTIFNVDLNDANVHGGNIRDIAVFQGVNLDGTTFKECVLTGSYTGYIAGETVQLADGLTGMHGIFKDSGVQGRMYFNSGVTCSILNCSSMVPGLLNQPGAFLNNDVKLSVRKYSGTMGVYDSTDGCESTFEFLAGNCRILSGNTGGIIIIGGIANLTDESSGTTVDRSTLLLAQDIATQHLLNVNTEILKNK